VTIAEYLPAASEDVFGNLAGALVIADHLKVGSESFSRSEGIGMIFAEYLPAAV